MVSIVGMEEIASFLRLWTLWKSVPSMRTHVIITVTDFLKGAEGENCPIFPFTYNWQVKLKIISSIGAWVWNDWFVLKSSSFTEPRQIWTQLKISWISQAFLGKKHLVIFHFKYHSPEWWGSCSLIGPELGADSHMHAFEDDCSITRRN